jgi:hypothetical protein
MLGVSDSSVGVGAFVAKFGSGYAFEGARTWDGEVLSLASAPADTLVSTGTFAEESNLGSVEHTEVRTARGPTDGFIMRFPWSEQTGVSGRAPAHCYTLAETALPQDFDQCEADGFASFGG